MWSQPQGIGPDYQGRIFKGHPSPFQGLLMFLGVAVYAGYHPFAPQIHSPSSSTLLYAPCGLCHYMDQALLPVLCWFASASGRYWQEFGGQGEGEVEGFILQVPSLPGQPGLPNSTRRWLLPLRPSGFCLFTALFFALPALGVVPAPCSYLH